MRHWIHCLVIVFVYVFVLQNLLTVALERPGPHDQVARFHGTSGLSTKMWGPSGWHFLFSCIMGAYPPELAVDNPDHVVISNQFRDMLMSLGSTLPCVFCRDSYKQFCRELPIDRFLGGRIKLMYWLYQIKDKVNRKLIRQEHECFQQEKEELFDQHRYGGLSLQELNDAIDQNRNKTLITIPSPPFTEVLDEYEQMRAVCSAKAQKCVSPGLL